VAEQVAEGAAAGQLPLEAPRQRPLGFGGVAGEERRAEVGDAPERALGDQLADVLHRRGVAVVEADGGDHAGGAGGRGDLAGLAGVAPDRLLDPEVLAGLGGGHADLAVQDVGGADGDHVDLGVGQDLAVVGAPLGVAEGVAGVGDPVGGGVGGVDQPGAQAQLRVDRGQRLVGAAVELAHPADADQPDADLVGPAAGRGVGGHVLPPRT
jgi:hypothetical protein